MAEFWGIIQGIGALVGLATGMFVLWERAIRDRPLAFIVPLPLLPGSMNRVSHLRIVNRSPRPMLVSWQSGENPDSFQVARDNSIREIVTALVPGEPTHVVGGNEIIDLPLLAPTRLDEIALDNVIETELRWSFAQPIIWQRPRKLQVRITKKAYLALLGKKDAPTTDNEIKPA